MTKEREALKLALEALEEAADAIDSWGSYASGYFQVKHDLEGDISKAKSAITAIREALAQPEQEPVAFGSVTVRRLSQRFENHHDQYQFYPAGQSPYLDNVDECHTVYTTQPHRKPLTDEEIDKLPWEPHEGNPMTFAEGLRYFARAIEAKLKEKNT